MDKVSRERNDVLHQNEEAWEENNGISKQLAEVLRLNENAVKQKDARLLEALSELEFERKARKSAEAKEKIFEDRIKPNEGICPRGTWKESCTKEAKRRSREH